MPRKRAVVLAVLLTTTLAAAPAAAQRDTPCHDREAGPSRVRIAAEDEPGERLQISGRVVAGADRDPIAGARVVAFHTDAEGYYSVGGMDERNARLCAVLLTDSNGRYEIDTIRPAHYATGGGPPAHVHFEVTLPGEQTKQARRFTLQFEGDPRLGGATGKDLWDQVRPLVGDHEGRQRVERDLWVR